MSARNGAYSAGPSLVIAQPCRLFRQCSAPVYPILMIPFVSIASGQGSNLISLCHKNASTLGRPAIDHLERWVRANLDCDVYFLGPKPFMAFIKRSLAALGLPSSRMHYEFFGPAETLD